MPEPSAIPDHPAERPRAARKARGLSLDAAGRLPGASRSMVSQIRPGESSPAVATLRNLTRAPGVDFAGLLADDRTPGIEVTCAETAPVIAAPGMAIRILSPPETVGRHKVHDLRRDPGGVPDSRPHEPGWREPLTVIAGRIALTSGPAGAELGPGGTARDPADRADRARGIAQRGKGGAQAILIVTQSG